jgi:hypothetical protein
MEVYLILPVYKNLPESRVVPRTHEPNNSGEADVRDGDMTKPPIAVEAISAVRRHFESYEYVDQVPIL